jgi:hypothetical protein
MAVNCQMPKPNAAVNAASVRAITMSQAVTGLHKAGRTSNALNGSGAMWIGGTHEDV